jgi:hypothetical protein
MLTDIIENKSTWVYRTPRTSPTNVTQPNQNLHMSVRQTHSKEDGAASAVQATRKGCAGNMGNTGTVDAAATGPSEMHCMVERGPAMPRQRVLAQMQMPGARPASQPHRMRCLVLASEVRRCTVAGPKTRATLIPALGC